MIWVPTTWAKAFGIVGTGGSSGASRMRPPVFFFCAAKGRTKRQARSKPSRGRGESLMR